MKRILAAVIAGMVLAPAGFAATPSDVTAPIHQFIDGFNKGDTKSAYAAFAPGSIMIIDEFAPHRWIGPNAVHAWAADFGKVMKADGVTDPAVAYDAPTRVEVEDKTAYVIVPTVYSYKQHDQPTAEEGQMTFVLNRGAGGWKISAWTWSGVKPHPAK